MKFQTLCATLFLIGSMTSRAQNAERLLPEAILNIRVGLGAAELIVARPNARFVDPKLKVTPEALRSGKHALLEQLPSEGGFHTATYWLEDGKVTTIVLSGTASPGQERKIRRVLVGDCVKRWGKSYRRVIREQTESRGPLPILSWATESMQIDVELPRNRRENEKRPNYFSLSVRSVTAAKRFPWKEPKLSDAERKAFLKDHDVDE